MHLKISHTTEYHYDEPVQYALQRLRLTPITGVGQTVLGWQTLVDGAAMEVSYDDHFGNRVHLVSVDGDRDGDPHYRQRRSPHRGPRTASWACISPTSRFGFMPAKRR